MATKSPESLALEKQISLVKRTIAANQTLLMQDQKSVREQLDGIFASEEEAVAGVATDKAVSPATLATVLEDYSPGGGGGSGNSYFPSGW